MPKSVDQYKWMFSKPLIKMSVMKLIVNSNITNYNEKHNWKPWFENSYSVKATWKIHSVIAICIYFELFTMTWSRKQIPIHISLFSYIHTKLRTTTPALLKLQRGFFSLSPNCPKGMKDNKSFLLTTHFNVSFVSHKISYTFKILKP